MTRSELLALWADQNITVTALAMLNHCKVETMRKHLEGIGIGIDEQLERRRQVKGRNVKRIMANRKHPDYTGHARHFYSASRYLPRCPRCELLTDDGGLCGWCQEDMIRVGGGR